MKKLIFLFIYPIIITPTLAQSTIGFQNDIKNIGSTSSGITTFNNSEVKGTRYVFDNWTNGSVTDIKNNVYSSNYTFNFDKINQDLYAKYNTPGSDISVVLDKSQIQRFTIGSLSFIRSSLLDPNIKDLFYNILVEDSAKVSLYKFTSTKFIKADPTDIMNVRTGNLSSEFKDENKYFVSVNKGGLKKINLTEGSIKKALKEKSDKVNNYFSLHSSSDIDENFLIELIKYVNQ